MHHCYAHISMIEDAGGDRIWREDQMLESYGHRYGDDQLIRIVVIHRYKLVKKKESSQ